MTGSPLSIRRKRAHITQSMCPPPMINPHHLLRYNMKLQRFVRKVKDACVHTNPETYRQQVYLRFSDRLSLYLAEDSMINLGVSTSSV